MLLGVWNSPQIGTWGHTPAGCFIPAKSSTSVSPHWSPGRGSNNGAYQPVCKEINDFTDPLTRAECADHCYRSSRCAAFAWARAGSSCRLKSNFNASAVFTGRGGLWDFCHAIDSDNSVIGTPGLCANRLLPHLTSRTSCEVMCTIYCCARRS